MKTSLNKTEMIAVLANYYGQMRDRWAREMSGLTMGLCKRDMIFLLAGFVLLGSSLNLLIVYNSFKNHTPENIRIPSKAKVLTGPQGKDSVLQPFAVSGGKYKAMMDFKMYLQREDSSERAFYDSLRVWRPGLLDSLVYIENYYRSNDKEYNDGK